MRNVLDKRGNWKQKSINRVFALLPHAEKNNLIKSIELTLPYAQKIVESLYNQDLSSVNKYSLGGC